MTFVYPLLLGGLLLAGLPVLLHLLVRQKPKPLLFPAFRFLMQKRRSNTRHLRLRHLLLLLLRMALLVLLCLALARPRVLNKEFGISRERPVALALIFDTSASMGYQVGAQTRLDLAKKRGLELLDQLPEDCRVLVLDSSDAANFGRADWLKSLAKARQVVKALTIRPDGTPITQALTEAQRRFDDWDRRGDDPEASQYPRVIGIFTDRTKGSWDAKATAMRTPREDAVKVQTMLFDVGIDDPVDLAITHLGLPADYRGGMAQSFAAGDKIPLDVVVKATGNATAISSSIVSTLAPEQAMNIEPGGQASPKLEIDTANLKSRFGQAEVKLSMGADQLPFNNQRFVTFEIHEPQRVLVLGDDVKKSDLLATWLRACLYQVEQRSVQDAKVIAGLDKFDAVFLDGVAEPGEKLWEALADFVAKKGGGLGIIPGGDGMKPDAYNTAAAQRVMPGTISAKVSPAAPNTGRWNDAAPDFDHPFFRRFETWFNERGIMSLPCRAEHYWKVEKPATVLVRYDDDQPAIIERTLPKGGTVLLLTTPLDEQTPAWNNYRATIHWFFEALTMLCARHLCPEPANPVLNYEFGREPPRVKLPPGYQKYLLVGPSVTEEIGDAGTWIGERLSSPGNYTIVGMSGEDKVILAAFSINVPGTESDLSRVPVSDIEASLGAGAVVPQDRKTSLPATLNWDEPMELFPWLMLALLFALALENLLANRFYRVPLTA